MCDRHPPILVLDAMGVIYEIGDDVRDLLIPFIIAHGGTRDEATIEREYREASLGRLRATEFWERVGLDSRCEDEYLRGFRLSNGLCEFLEDVVNSGLQVACLSNDVTEWSAKLRRSFDLERYISPWVISGDVRLRKPDPRIYDILITRLGVRPDRVIFVDDQQRNLTAAAQRGIRTVRYAGQLEQQGESQEAAVAHSFPEVFRMAITGARGI